MSQATTAERSARGQLAAEGRARPAARARILRVPPIIIGFFTVLALLIVVALAAPLIATHDPGRQDLLARLQPPAGFEGGSSAHLLGTDHLGRDVFSRLVYGARVSLGIGLVGMLIGMTIGSTLGILAGYVRGILDEAVMFLVDVQLALPFLIIALGAIAIYGTSLTVLILVIGFFGWEYYARITRGMVLSARGAQYVQAAEALGASQMRVMVRHVLPNISAPIIVWATFQLTGIILLETSLSFLGIGVQPPTPSWGSMIGEGRDFLNTAWWIAVVPGVTIVLATMTVSLLGDWLRDVFDPTLRGRS
ncbi:MAG: ABC transporter permease [Chloroflexota bacterium]